LLQDRQDDHGEKLCPGHCVLLQQVGVRRVRLADVQVGF